MRYTEGSVHLDVARLQTKLKRFFLGEVMTVNGVFDQRTKSLVVKFQDLHPGKSEKGVITDDLFSEIDAVTTIRISSSVSDETPTISVNTTEPNSFYERQADGVTASLRYFGKSVKRNFNGGLPTVSFAGNCPADFYAAHVQETVSRDVVDLANRSKVTLVKSPLEALHVRQAGVSGTVRVLVPGVPDKFKYTAFDLTGPTIFGAVSNDAETVISAFQRAFETNRDVRLKIAVIGGTVRTPNDPRISASSVDPSQLPSWISCLSIFVSCRFSGIELLAAACGRPTIAVKFELPDHGLDDRNSYLIANKVYAREKFEDELIANMAMAAVSKDALVEKGIHGAVLASTHSFQKVASDLLKYISDLGF